MWQIKWCLQLIFGHMQCLFMPSCHRHSFVGAMISFSDNAFSIWCIINSSILKKMHNRAMSMLSHSHSYYFREAISSRETERSLDAYHNSPLFSTSARISLISLYFVVRMASHRITSTDVQRTIYDFGFHSGNNMEARRTDHTKWNSFDVTWPFDTDNSIIQHLNRLIVFIVVLICPDDWIVVHFGWIRNDWSQSTTIDISLAIAFGYAYAYAYNWPNVIEMRLNKWNICAFYVSHWIDGLSDS